VCEREAALSIPSPQPTHPPKTKTKTPIKKAPGDDSEVYLVARAIYRDPFRGGDNILVMCDAYLPPAADGSTKELVPIPTNTRAACAAACAAAESEEPWFGIEQEYTLLNTQTKWPLGWPSAGYPGPQGPYYCSAGAGAAIGRDIIEAHYKACLFAGINISGVNAEVMPAQWEYQVGPCVGIEMGDQLWMSRYILLRVCEVSIDFDFLSVWV
jgi:glutamine synthetase